MKIVRANSPMAFSYLKDKLKPPYAVEINEFLDLIKSKLGNPGLFILTKVQGVKDKEEPELMGILVVLVISKTLAQVTQADDVDSKMMEVLKSWMETNGIKDLVMRLGANEGRPSLDLPFKKESVVWSTSSLVLEDEVIYDDEVTDESLQKSKFRMAEENKSDVEDVENVT